MIQPDANQHLHHIPNQVPADTLHSTLPLSVKQSTSLPGFENHIKTHDFSKFLKGSASVVN
jgi:hypothetical protein